MEGWVEREGEGRRGVNSMKHTATSGNNRVDYVVNADGGQDAQDPGCQSTQRTIRSLKYSLNETSRQQKADVAFTHVHALCAKVQFCATIATLFLSQSWFHRFPVGPCSRVRGYLVKLHISFILNKPIVFLKIITFLLWRYFKSNCFQNKCA